jgi:hypothetical protein
MTGAPAVLDHPALRAALTGMRIETPAPGTAFEAALAARQGWSPRFAGRVAQEYRRFLYLAAIAGVEVTPSQFVDEAWHLHLELPHYGEILCGRILGRPLEHRPGTGTAEDDARCARQYEQTLALYERIFGEPPPDDIWPRPFEEAESRPALGRGRIGAATVAAGLVAALAVPAAGSPALAPVLVIGAAIVGLILFPMEKLTGVGGRRRDGAGCGGSCGGGGGGDSSCGASCGGGCGGGCGGD